MLEVAEVEDDDDADEDFQNQQEFALREEVGLAGFPDQLGDFAHRFVDGQIAQLLVSQQTEQQAERADTRPAMSSVRPSMPRNVAWLRSGRMRWASPPPCGGGGFWAKP